MQYMAQPPGRHAEECFIVWLAQKKNWRWQLVVTNWFPSEYVLYNNLHIAGYRIVLLMFEISTVTICAQSVAAACGRRGAMQPQPPTGPPPNAAYEQYRARMRTSFQAEAGALVQVTRQQVGDEPEAVGDEAEAVADEAEAVADEEAEAVADEEEAPQFQDPSGVDPATAAWQRVAEAARAARAANADWLAKSWAATNAAIAYGERLLALREAEMAAKALRRATAAEEAAAQHEPEL